MPPREEAMAWLQSRGYTEGVAREALDATRGHPALADQWLQGEGMALRRQVASELEQLLAGKLGSVELAQRWTGDDNADLRLRHAADLALKKAADGLTDPARLNKLAAWFDAANRTRDLLRTTIRADLAVVELLLAWGAANQVQSKGTIR